MKKKLVDILLIGILVVLTAFSIVFGLLLLYAVFFDDTTYSFKDSAIYVLFGLLFGFVGAIGITHIKFAIEVSKMK